MLAKVANKVKPDEKAIRDSLTGPIILKDDAMKNEERIIPDSHKLILPLMHCFQRRHFHFHLYIFAWVFIDTHHIFLLIFSVDLNRLRPHYHFPNYTFTSPFHNCRYQSLEHSE